MISGAKRRGVVDVQTFQNGYFSVDEEKAERDSDTFQVQATIIAPA